VCYGQRVEPEPTSHCRVFDDLHIDGVGGDSAFQFGNYEATVQVQAKDVQPVTLRAARHHPSVILHGDNHHTRPEDLWVGNHPLLQVLTFQETRSSQRTRRHGNRSAARFDGE
jgi:hypothetical protein